MKLTLNLSLADKVKTHSWARDVLGRLKSELAPLLDDAPAIPQQPGGWWHQYVCPEHHTELLFDPAEPDAHAYYCPYGCKLEGEPYRGAWLVMKHQAWARYALQAAAVYAAEGDERYARLSRSILLDYAAQFPQYPTHPDAEAWMLRGRAFHQALTEAIWATTLFRAYLLLKDEGVSFANSQPVMDTFVAMLDESLSQARVILVDEKKKPESNYTAWLNAALACIYAIREDRVRFDELVNGNAGLKHHLTIGVKPDQFEYEGSVYYHVFVLRAYWIVVEMGARFGLDLSRSQGEDGQSLEGMLDVLAGLAHQNGELPALHDGPLRRVPYAREIAEVMEAGYARFGKPAYVPVLREAYRQLGGKPDRYGLEALLYGEGEWTGQDAAAKSSLLLASSGFVVGRRPGGLLSFYSDFGAHGGSHGHYDKLHLTIGGRHGWITPEAGMVPYGSALRKDWYAATASHNTVVVGGKSQAPHTGELVRFEETDRWTYCWLRSQGAYEGCTLNRHLLLTSEWLLDWFEAESAKPAIIDWWTHAESLTPAYSRGLWKPAPAVLGAETPYDKIDIVSAWTGAQGSAAIVELADGSGADSIAAALLTSAASSLLVTESPAGSDNPARRRKGLLHRQSGTNVQFVAVYSAASVPANLEWLEAEEGAKRAELSFRTGERLAAALSASGLTVEPL